jgi:hypothetical protein
MNIGCRSKLLLLLRPRIGQAAARSRAQRPRCASGRSFTMTRPFGASFETCLSPDDPSGPHFLLIFGEIVSSLQLRRQMVDATVGDSVRDAQIAATCRERAAEIVQGVMR